MKYELDDPKITAYALGELDDAEKAQVEAFLNENEAARNEVAQIRDAAQWLTAELGAEVSEGLSEFERARIVEQAKSAKPAGKSHWARWAVAASLVALAGGAWFGTMEGFKYGRKSAEADKDFKRVAVAKSVELPAPAQVSADGRVVSANAPAAADQRANEERPHTVPPVTHAQKQAAETASGASAVSSDDLARLSEQNKKEAERSSGAAAQQAPAQPSAKPADTWNTIGTKTMSQQPVIGDEGSAQVSTSAPAPAAAPATPSATGELQNVEVGGKIQIRDYYYAARPENGKTRLNVRADFTPSESREAEAKDGLRALGYVGANAPGVPEKKADVAQLQAYIVPTPPTPVPGSETYPVLPENAFQRVVDAPLSTFGLDVDTASYANVRRFLTQGTLPPGEAVRIEEMINYFKYDYPKPEGDAPFSVTVDAHPCPWAPTHTLARIGVRGKELNTETRPPANLVFLIDVSGSMQDADKLPLLKKGMKLLAQTTTAKDRVTIVTYASGTGVALYPTAGDNRAVIESIIDTLQAGGSTNGAGGIQLAYDLARQAFLQGGVNRVILATDGDFNVGVSDTNTLVGMIEQQAKTGVALSVLGFGQGNLKDERMMKLADKGNGNYAYIDSFQEARKVLLEQAAGTLFTIAKDVKIQIEFNPGKVGAYRLIGYEKRMLAAQDFNDDRKDAGEIGAGHTVTALYELVPPGEAIAPPQTDPLKYQTTATPEPAAPPATDSPELMTVKLRFKPPTGDVSTRFDVPIPATIVTAETRPDFQFASAVAAFGMLLRHSSYAGTATMDMVINLAQQGKGADENGLRAEFINLAKTASALMGGSQPMLR